MALDRQVELAMDAMQASHDAMLGHMALVRDAVQGVPVAEGESAQEKVAGDVVPMGRKEPIQLWNVEKPAGYQAESPEQAEAVSKGVLRGSIHILKPTPEGKRSEAEGTVQLAAADKSPKAPARPPLSPRMQEIMERILRGELTEHLKPQPYEAPPSEETGG